VPIDRILPISDSPVPDDFKNKLKRRLNPVNPNPAKKFPAR